MANRTFCVITCDQCFVSMTVTVENTPPRAIYVVTKGSKTLLLCMINLVVVFHKQPKLRIICIKNVSQGTVTGRVS